MKKTFGRSNVFWGIALICAALLLIIDSVGSNLGFFELPVFKIILCVLIGAWGVTEVMKGKPQNIFLPLAFIFAILQDDISVWVGHGGEKFVSTWIVIVAGLLLQIGFSALVPKGRIRAGASGANGGSVERGDGYYENDLGASTCYVDAAKLGYYKVENDLGKLDVYIENVEAYTGSGTLEVDNNLGQTVIHVPAGWAVENRVTSSLGSVTCSVPTTGSPMLTIIGSCDLGNVSIQ